MYILYGRKGVLNRVIDTKTWLVEWYSDSELDNRIASGYFDELVGSRNDVLSMDKLNSVLMHLNQKGLFPFSFKFSNDGYLCLSRYFGDSTTVNIPFNDIIIEDSCFEGSNLQEVILHNVKRIGSRAFANCINLRSVLIPSGVEKIGRSAFEGCTSLESVVYESKSEIPAEMFKNCIRLARFVSPNLSVNFDDFAFSSTRLVK